jgi:hypothetical protein
MAWFAAISGLQTDPVSICYILPRLPYLFR